MFYEPGSRHATIFWKLQKLKLEIRVKLFTRPSKTIKTYLLVFLQTSKTDHPDLSLRGCV
jgi:hypothetical protein